MSDAYADDRAHVFHSWSAQGSLTPLVVAGGEGSWFWTEDGTRYLDFSSQLVNVNIGHQHPKLVAAIQEQAGTAVHDRPVPRQRGAQRGGPADQRGGQPRRTDDDHFSHVFFTNAGAEATENAVRMARLHTGRHKLLTTYRSYHGGTGGAITLTGDPRRWPSEPGIPGVVKFWGPYPYRSAFHADRRGRGVRTGARPPRRRADGRGPAQRRGDHARDRRRHQRHPRAARRLPRRRARAAATATAS